MTNPGSPLPLAGVRIIDLTQVLAGPYCSYQLALLGAEVIKVEPPGEGDMTRRGGAVAELNPQQLGLSFCTQNSQKAAVTADLKDPAGLEIVQRLIEGADVFLENFRPGVSERLGLGYDAVTAIKPDIVYASISAYGNAGGPIGHRPAFDHVVQAMSGVMGVNGNEGSGPLKVGMPYIDYATGLNGAFAVLAAIMARQQTGQPQRVDVAMLDTAHMLMISNVTATMATGQDPPKLGNEAASRAPSSGCYETADGLLSLAANKERQFVLLCDALGLAELATDQRFARPVERAEHQDELRAAFNEAFLTKTAAEWEEILDAHGVPAARARTLTEVLDEGQPASRGMFTELPVGEHDTSVSLPAIGFRLGEAMPAPTRPPQPLGSDNHTVLTDLGYTPAEITQLESDGVI